MAKASFVNDEILNEPEVDHDPCPPDYMTELTDPTAEAEPEKAEVSGADAGEDLPGPVAASDEKRGLFLRAVQAFDASDEAEENKGIVAVDWRANGYGTGSDLVPLVRAYQAVRRGHLADVGADMIAQLVALDVLQVNLAGVEPVATEAPRRRRRNRAGA